MSSQTKHRFYEEKKPTEISRRTFIDRVFGFLMGLTGVGVLGGIISYFWPAQLDEMFDEAAAGVKVDEMEPDSSVEGIPFGRYTAMLIRLENGDYRAYSSVCTHFACLVKYVPRGGREDEDREYAIEPPCIACPCHEGYFDPDTGAVLSGPPNRPLLRLVVEDRDGWLWLRPMNESEQMEW